MRSLKLQTLIEAAIMAALAMIIDLLPFKVMQYSTSFAMVPIFLIAFRWGVRAGAISGFLWGLLQVITGDAGPNILNVLQGFIEYFVAFAFIGFAGFLQPVIQRKNKERKKIQLLLYTLIAIIIGSFARYIWHFIAGIIFWGSFAPKGQSPVLYSLVLNGTTMISDIIFCAVILCIILPIAPRLLQK